MDQIQRALTEKSVVESVPGDQQRIWYRTACGSERDQDSGESWSILLFGIRPLQSARGIRQGDYELLSS